MRAQKTQNLPLLNILLHFRYLNQGFLKNSTMTASHTVHGRGRGLFASVAPPVLDAGEKIKVKGLPLS